MFSILKKVLFTLLAISLISCQNEQKNTLKIGVIAGPEAELMQVAKQEAAKTYHLNLQVIEFTDYIQPNSALNDGSIDANMFQHEPYLEKQIQDKHYPLVVIGKTFLYPMGIYSAKLKNLDALPAGSLVAIPNDPSNEGRALLLLQKAKLIQLSPNAGLYATPQNITNNPKQLKFKELDAAQLGRVLPDVTLAVINTNYAIPSGLTPTKDALFLEGKDSPYVNIIVTREDRKNDPRMQQLVSALQSEAVKKEAIRLFNGQAIQGW